VDVLRLYSKKTSRQSPRYLSRRLEPAKGICFRAASLGRACNCTKVARGQVASGLHGRHAITRPGLWLEGYPMLYPRSYNIYPLADYFRTHISYRYFTPFSSTTPSGTSHPTHSTSSSCPHLLHASSAAKSGKKTSHSSNDGSRTLVSRIRSTSGWFVVVVDWVRHCVYIWEPPMRKILLERVDAVLRDETA
jgi:hypothetical protein